MEARQHTPPFAEPNSAIVIRSWHLINRCRSAPSTLEAQLSALSALVTPSSQEHHFDMVVLVQFVTPDLSMAKRFYAGLFGWHFRNHILVVMAKKLIWGCVATCHAAAWKAAGMRLRSEQSDCDALPTFSWPTSTPCNR